MNTSRSFFLVRWLAVGAALLCGLGEFACLQRWRWRDRTARRA